MKPRRAGFTLVELMIVTVVIGILAAIAVPRFRATAAQAQLGVLRADLRNLAMAEEIYRTTNGEYVPLSSLAEYAPSEGVLIEFRWIRADAYAARASHAAAPGWECWYIVGSVPPGHTRPVAGASRQVLCVRS